MNRRTFFRSVLSGFCVGLAAATLKAKSAAYEMGVDWARGESMGIAGVWEKPVRDGFADYFADYANFSMSMAREKQAFLESIVPVGAAERVSGKYITYPVTHGRYVDAIRGSS